MANLTPEQEQQIRENIRLHGIVVYNPEGWMVLGDERAKVCNFIYGTNIVNDEALDRVFQLEKELEAEL
jgi:hypothetical protein